MSNWLKQVIKKVKNVNATIDEYKKDTVIQSLPSLAFVNRAKKLIDEQKYTEAKDLLMQALELPQKDALVYEYLGLVYNKLKDFNASVDAYQTSADINPQDKNIWQKLGFALIAVEKSEEALKAFTYSDKIAPMNTDTYTGWGMALMKLENYEDAIRKFNKATKINKYNFSAIFLGSVLDVKLKNYNKAETKLTFLTSVAPNAINTYEFANLKYIKGNYKSAIIYATKSLGYNPNMLLTYILLGKLYAKNCKMETALSYFQKAQDKELISETLYLEWAIALEKFQKYQEALEKLLEGIKLDENDLEIISHLGLCYAILGRIDEAKQSLEKVFAKEPENYTAKQALGLIAYKNNETEKAIELLKSCLDNVDNDYLNYYYLAKCYETLKDDMKIKDNYETTILKNPEYTAAYLGYANYLITCQNYSEAQRKLRKALKIDADNIEILNLLFYVSYILVKENICEYNIKEALAIAQKIETISPELFEYHNEKADLSEILKSISERD